MNKPFSFSTSMSMLLIAALITGSLLSASALAHGGAKGIVKERMDVMKTMGKGMKKVGAMIKGEETFDPEITRSQAKAISEASPGIPDLFTEGSLQKASEVLPAIWKEWDDFSALTVKLKEHEN